MYDLYVRSKPLLQRQQNARGLQVFSVAALQDDVHYEAARCESQRTTCCKFVLIVQWNVWYDEEAKKREVRTVRHHVRLVQLVRAHWAALKSVVR